MKHERPILPVLVFTAVLAAALSLGVDPGYGRLSSISLGQVQAARAKYRVCGPGQLRISVPGSPDYVFAAMGTLTWDILFKNIGTTGSCVLRGWPGIAIGVHGKRVRISSDDTTLTHYWPVPEKQVVLAKGQSAAVTVDTSSEAAGCSSPWTLQISLPGSSGPVSAREPAASFGPCGERELQLSPFYPLRTLSTKPGPLRAQLAARSRPACARESLSWRFASAAVQKGESTLVLRLQNRGPGTCTLSQFWPSVTVHGPAGKSLTATPLPQALTIGAITRTLAASKTTRDPQPLTLRPGATASVVLVSPAASAKSCARANVATIHPSGDTQDRGLDAPLARATGLCGQEAYVLPFLPGRAGSTVLWAAARALSPRGTGASPAVAHAANPAGFWYGSDSNGPAPCGRGPWTMPAGSATSGPCSKTQGYYGWYVGEAGSYAHWQGCTSDFWYSLNFQPGIYADAVKNVVLYGKGVGFSAYWLMAGPGRDPHYNGTNSEAYEWGARQGRAAVRALAGKDLTWPLIVMDIEDVVHTGWNAVWDGPCGGIDEAGFIPANVDRSTFNGFWHYIRRHTCDVPAVYSSPGGGNSWGAVFGSETIKAVWEWTYENETSSIRTFPSAWSVPRGPSTEFFGGQTSGSLFADAWQWSGGNGQLNGVGDFDQVDANRRPGPHM